MHELPLVIFTVLAQTAVGITLFATLGMLTNKISQAAFTKALWAALFALIVGGIASTFHLGQPLRAFNVLAGVGRSPMSNEIISTILFGGFLFGAVVCSKIGKEGLTKPLSILASIAGVALVFVIPTIYTIETVPQWNTIFTPAYMLLTACTMGAAAVYLVSAERLFAYVAIISLLVGMLMMPLYFTHTGLSAPVLLEKDMLFWVMRLAFAGLAILSLTLIGNAKEKTAAFGSIAVILVAASELSGRVGFFELWQMGM